MKQYFAYGAFAVCLANAVYKSDMYSVLLVAFAVALLIASSIFAEADLEKRVKEILTKHRHILEENKKGEEFFEKRLEEIFRRLEAFEAAKAEVAKDLADTKRVVRDINLANTFVPRAKRGGNEL